MARSGAAPARAAVSRIVRAAGIGAHEWALTDVQTRGAGMAVVANADAQLARARAEWAAWDAQVNRIAGAR